MFERAAAFRNVRDTVAIAMEHGEGQPALIVADDDCELARLLCDAYQEALPGARTLIYDSAEPDVAKAALNALGPGDLAVLLQSSVFRIPSLRIRVALFQRDVKVIEHANLDRMVGEEIGHFFDAMAYDPAYYRTVGHALKARIDSAQSARIESGGETLHFDCPLESAKLNIGDFGSLKNVGSLFPIGEVFTEASDLEKVSGRARLYAFMDTTMRLDVPPDPITIVVERGRVVDTVNSTSEFDSVLAMIRRDEGQVWLRELGFGMNRALSRDRRLSDVAAFERVCGVHLSLGARHGIYKKPHLNHREARYHVDTFVVTERVWLDDSVVFQDGGWTVSSA